MNKGISTSGKAALLHEMVAELKEIPGVAAIVLGGSQAAGYATPASDLDIGIYYFEEAPFNIESIRNIANQFSLNDQAIVTGFYEWGPWVNGGAWIETSAGKVDFIYRNIKQVQQVLTDAANGIWHHHYDQQPPFGFRSVIYLAEINICQPLFDPGNIIQALKKEVAVYPSKLKQTIISDALWLAEFSLLQCEPFARAGDVYNTAGCFTRIANYLVHALFAINEAYPLGDKRAMTILASLEYCPKDLKDVLDKVLGNAGREAKELVENTSLLKGLWTEIVGLTKGGYRSRF